MSGSLARTAGLGAAAVLLLGTTAAQPPPHPDEQALACVRPRLYRVVSSGDAEKRGTAYLLKVEEVDGARLGYFVTCYHVVNGQKTVDLYPTPAAGANPLAPVSPTARFAAGKKGFDVRVVPSLDLVFLRAPVPGLGVAGKPEPAGDGLLPTAYVFGFPGFDPARPYPMSVRVAEGSRPANRFPFYQPPANDPGPRMDVRFLTREVTVPGMSGGPVLDLPCGTYAGMLLGRIPDQTGVLIHARQVFEELDRPGPWPEFHPDRLTAPLPYPPPPKDGRAGREQDFGQYAADTAIESEKNWAAYDQWTQALGDDPTDLLRDFQEVGVRVEDLRLVTGQGNAAPLAVADAGRDGHEVTFRWNGRELKEGEAAVLRPGENLLIVSRRMRGDGFVLNDLFRPNPLAVDLKLGGKVAFRLRRSLPATIRAYTIFVTVHNGDIAAAAEKEHYDARLAVRLDYLNRLVTRVPFCLPLRGADPRTGSSYDGEAGAEGDFLELRYASPQSLDVALTSTLTVNWMEARFGGVRVAFPPDSLRPKYPALAGVGSGLAVAAADIRQPPRRYPLTMAGRVQFPAAAPAPVGVPGPAGVNGPVPFFVAPRALAARSTAPLRLPLFGPDVEVDVGPIVREALVCYVNKELLIPEKAAVPGADQLNKLLIDAGLLDRLNGHSLHPVRAFLKREPGAGPDDQHRVWVVLTFRLGSDGKSNPAEKPARPAAKEPPEKPPLLPDPAVRDTVGMEFNARGLPLAAGRPHLVRPAPAAAGGNRLGQELATRNDGRVVVAEKFRIAVPSDGLPGRAGVLTLDAKAEKLGDAVGQVLRAAFADSAKTVEARLPADALVRLLAALPPGKALLDAKPDCRGGVRLKAVIGPKDNTIDVRLGDAGYSVEWKGPVALAPGFTATGLKARLTKAELSGSLAAAAFRGQLAGEVTADKLEVGQDVLTGVTVTVVTADVDSARGPKEQLRLCLNLKVGERRSPNKKPEKDLELKGIRLNLGAGTTSDEAKKLLLKLLDPLIFLPKDC